MPPEDGSWGFPGNTVWYECARRTKPRERQLPGSVFRTGFEAATEEMSCAKPLISRGSQQARSSGLRSWKPLRCGLGLVAWRVGARGLTAVPHGGSGDRRVSGLATDRGQPVRGLRGRQRVKLLLGSSTSLRPSGRLAASARHCAAMAVSELAAAGRSCDSALRWAGLAARRRACRCYSTPRDTTLACGRGGPDGGGHTYA